MNEDLANLDAFAAGSECILKCLPTADDAHSTQLFGKIYPNVGPACRGDHFPLSERQMAKTSLDNLDSKEISNLRREYTNPGGGLVLGRGGYIRIQWPAKCFEACQKKAI